jgi:hypothetical protein
MRKWSSALAVLAAAALAVAACARPSLAAQRPQRNTPPDSFLWQKVGSVPELISQVQQNALVRKHLAAHFKVPEKDLTEYLKRNLTVVTIQKSGRYPVWGVTRTGRIYRSSSYFRKGWRAFGLKDGTPLLKWSCGNPMVTSLPEVPTPMAQLPPPVSLPPPPAPPPPAPVDTAEAVTPMVSQPEEAIPPSPLYVASAPAPAAPATTLAVRTTAPWLLLPLLFHTGGGPPIPEPATLTLLGAGAVALGALGRLRRRRR